MKISLVDFLFTENGSFLDDIRFIESCLENTNYISYRKFKSSDALIKKAKSALGLYADSSGLLIILSSKLWILYLLAPLCLFKRVAFVYHFIPKHRENLHRQSMKILGCLYTVIVYSRTLKDLLYVRFGVKAVYLPSRCIDKKRASDLLKTKLNARFNQLLVPGVRDGVRNIQRLNLVLEKIKENKVLDIKNIVIQMDGDCPVIMNNIPTTAFSSLSHSLYSDLFDNSLCVYIDFDAEYELRASGVVLDAIASGCIVFTNAHPITLQYGYPNSLLVDIDTFSDSTYPLNVDRMLALTDVMDFDTSKMEWNKFVNDQTII